MAKPQFIELTFHIKNITSSTPLGQKLNSLHQSPVLTRFMVDLDFMDKNQQKLLSTDAIFDTGAPISVFPH